MCIYMHRAVWIWLHSRRPTLLQHCRLWNVKCIESAWQPLSNLYNIAMYFTLSRLWLVNLNSYTCTVLICIESNWLSSLFTMAVLGCRLFMLVIKPSTKKIIITVRISSWTTVIMTKIWLIYDENMTKIWWNYDSLFHFETKRPTIINLPSSNSPLTNDQS